MFRGYARRLDGNDVEGIEDEIPAGQRDPASGSSTEQLIIGDDEEGPHGDWQQVDQEATLQDLEKLRDVTYSWIVGSITTDTSTIAKIEELLMTLTVLMSSPGNAMLMGAQAASKTWHDLNIRVHEEKVRAHEKTCMELDGPAGKDDDDDDPADPDYFDENDMFAGLGDGNEEDALAAEVLGGASGGESDGKKNTPKGGKAGAKSAPNKRKRKTTCMDITIKQEGAKKKKSTASTAPHEEVPGGESQEVPDVD